MRFDLKRPCVNCPFRADVAPFLTAARVRGIWSELLRGSTFSCHKTNDFVDDEDGETITLETAKSQHCAGAAIMLEKLGRPNQLMRIAERLGIYDASKLDMEAPVFKTPRQMEDAQKKAGRTIPNGFA